MKVSWILITDLVPATDPCCAACTLDVKHVRWYRVLVLEEGVWGPRFRVWVLYSHRSEERTEVCLREGNVGLGLWHRDSRL